MISEKYYNEVDENFQCNRIFNTDKFNLDESVQFVLQITSKYYHQKLLTYKYFISTITIINSLLKKLIKFKSLFHFFLLLSSPEKLKKFTF